MQFQHRTVKRTSMAYLAVRISVNNPSGKKGTSNVREALSLVMDQVKILLDNLQMVDPSVIFFPHKAKDRVGVELDLIAKAEHVHHNCDFMHKYFPQFYVNKHGTYMYSNVIMNFNTPYEELLHEIINILYGEHQAMYPRELQVENCVIVGSFLYSHIYMQGKRLMESLSHLSGYHMKARWKEISTRPRRREGDPPDVACGNRRERQKASYQIPGIHVQHTSEKVVSYGLQTTFTLRCERLYWDTDVH
jgi:hypothetical protein